MESKRRKGRRAAGGDAAGAAADAAKAASPASSSLAELFSGIAPAAASAGHSPETAPVSLSDTFSRLFAGGPPAGGSSSSRSAPASRPPVAAGPSSGAAAAGKDLGDRGAAALQKPAPPQGEAAANKKRKAAGSVEQGAAKKPRLSASEEKERQARTLFIGNVPLQWDRKDVKTALRAAVGDKYTGQFKPIWFRAVPVKARWTSMRKVGSILGEYDESAADAKTAYVVLESPDAVPVVRRALHGVEADKRHKLRADGVGESATLQVFDRKRSVFVGNLGSNVGEADLRAVFEEAGEVNAVRVVRDKETKRCKGIAFVLFKERSSVKAALQYWGAQIGGREIRVTKVENRDSNAGEGGAPGGGAPGAPPHPAAARIENKLKRRRIKKQPKSAEPRKAKRKKDGRPVRSQINKGRKKPRKAKQAKR